MNKRLQFFETEPIIAAVKTEEQLERALTSGSNIIFFLFGNICNIPKLVESVKERGKYAFVHLDLIELVPGLMPKIIRQVHSLHRTPLTAGGLIRDKEDTVSALSAGAVSISTSCEEAWQELDSAQTPAQRQFRKEGM